MFNHGAHSSDPSNNLSALSVDHDPHELIHKRVLDDDLSRIFAGNDSATEANNTELNKHNKLMSLWLDSNKPFAYDEGFFARLTVVALLMVMLALVLMFVRSLRNRGKLNGVYGAIPNTFTDEKSSGNKFTALNTAAYEDDDEDDEVSVFDASQHKLLSKDRQS